MTISLTSQYLRSAPASHYRDAGFPLANQTSFDQFKKIPHLFQDGAKILEWIQKTKTSQNISKSQEAALELLQRFVFTAGVTATPDLWLTRQILSSLKKSGVLDSIQKRASINIAQLAKQTKTDPKRLTHDLTFLYTRGYLDKTRHGFIRAEGPAGDLLKDISVLPDEFRCNMAGELQEWFLGHSGKDQKMKRWVTLPPPSTPIDKTELGWIASSRDWEIGYRLLPVVTALQAAGALASFNEGGTLSIFKEKPLLVPLFQEAGIINLEEVITPLGYRVLEKGPGIFGIIGAYYTFLNEDNAHVDRAPNIVASQLANRMSFKNIMEELDTLFQQPDTFPTVFIEHALGMGLGIQMFRDKFRDRIKQNPVKCVGADYEQTALDKAKVSGKLSQDMIYIQADIGNPEQLLQGLRKNGIDPSKERIVMIVGNGFHEVRGKSNAEMTQLFERLAALNITLVFTEETKLTPDQVRDSAWESYHAGFGWSHSVSGQHLRTYEEWVQIGKDSGYQVTHAAQDRKRRLFPFPKKNNPPISETYRMIPSK